MKKLYLLLSCGLILACGSSSKNDQKAGSPQPLEYDYSQLVMMDSEQIEKILFDKQSSVRQEVEFDETQIVSEEALEPVLLESLRIILARPDQDGIRSRLYGQITRQLNGIGRFEKVLNQLADESIAGINNTRYSPNIQVTYIIILENLMAEMKPDLMNSEFYKSLFIKIKKADIDIPTPAESYYRLQSMRKVDSPSLTAERILDQLAKKQKQKKKK